VTIDPATLDLLMYPEPVLRRKAQDVPAVDDLTRAVAARMIEVMRKEDGVGLAAPQIGLAWRMFVADVPATDGRSATAEPPTATHGPVVYVNPRLTVFVGAPDPDEEGCLSLPGIRGDVLRPPVASLTAIGLDGKAFTASAGGLLARCWQHEIDHLDGVLIIDRMTQMSRLRNRARVRDLERGADKASRKPAARR
jgi:peptide deformylase